MNFQPLADCKEQEICSRFRQSTKLVSINADRYIIEEFRARLLASTCTSLVYSRRRENDAQQQQLAVVVVIADREGERENDKSNQCVNAHALIEANTVW